MREALRRHMSLPSFALVALALFVVASGSATAASLLTSKNIKDESIQNRDLRDGAFTLSKLRKSTKDDLRADSELTLARLAALEQKAGIPGPAGASGTTGTAGKNGDAGKTGETGKAGEKGGTGATGATGADGANPATPVEKSGDAGFKFSGGPTMAEFRRGALHVPGGIDGDTPQGGIGLAKQYDNVPLSTFSALGYSYFENKKASGDKATVHVTVFGAVKGVDSKNDSGFTNFVYNPALNGLTDRDATVDGFAQGNQWYSTGAPDGAASGGMQNRISIQEFIARNKDAKIVQISFDNGGSTIGTSAPEDTDISIDNGIIGFGNTFTRYDFGK